MKRPSVEKQYAAIEYTKTKEMNLEANVALLISWVKAMTLFLTFVDKFDTDSN